MGKLPAGYHRTPEWNAIHNRYRAAYKAACLRLEPRSEYQVACWNWADRKLTPRMHAEFKAGTTKRRSRGDFQVQIESVLAKMAARAARKSRR